MSPRGSIQDSSENESAPSIEEAKSPEMALDSGKKQKKRSGKKPKKKTLQPKLNILRTPEKISFAHKRLGAEIFKFLGRQSQFVHIYNQYVVIINVEDNNKVHVVKTSESTFELAASFCIPILKLFTVNQNYLVYVQKEGTLVIFDLDSCTSKEYGLSDYVFNYLRTDAVALMFLAKNNFILIGDNCYMTHEKVESDGSKKADMQLVPSNYP